MKEDENKRYNFTSNDIIGRGGYGYVYKSIDPKTNENVAIKEIYFNNGKEKDNILNEIYIMEHIDSCYSIKLKDKYENGKYYYLVMELCDENLDNYVKKMEN